MGEARVGLHLAALLAIQVSALVQHLKRQKSHAHIVQTNGRCQLRGLF